MLWLFSILVVLVMGGIAVVAAGHGQPMRAVDHDRAGVPVPDGEVFADDVRRVRFSLAFRGYRMSEVDDLLDRLAAQLPERSESPDPTPSHAPDQAPSE